MKSNVKPYNYAECGIKNVMIYGVSPTTDDDGDEIVIIKNIKGLHLAIAEAVIRKTGKMLGEEMRFLRTEMGKTQEELSETIGYDRQQIARWEKGSVEIPHVVDIIVRTIAVQNLLKSNMDIENTSRRIKEAPSRSLDIEADENSYAVRKLA